ncbi:anti-sigma B factor RsbW [Cohnella faecalis]|uniref:Anti-sigma B factor RsbW n=1 Tax=Cohnella faecalis TaxID=2315694 RepID=A0A398CJT8_9BACL|nr:anti-sigma B factor RsbW [Cohnella faecalis]RIE02615.1 anti-sigma B factor RsbW [Cohnella faecalis]
MILEGQVTLTVPARAEFIDIIRLNLYGFATKMKFSFEEIEDMKVAVSEACNNAVLHAYGAEDGIVEVTFVASEEELVITVRDRGVSFSPSGIGEGKTLHGKTIDEIQSGGLGLYLMQALMDRVEVSNENGTAVTLAKRRAQSKETA